MKPITKEILISILLFVVILLVFGVILYEYIPINKVIPTVTEYKATEEVKEQLKEIATEDTSNIILTYEISDSDLGVYESTKSYNKGKANPFSSYNSQETTTDSNVKTNNANSSTTTNGSTGNNSTQSSSTNINSNDNSQNENTFYEDTQTK